MQANPLVSSDLASPSSLLDAQESSDSAGNAEPADSAGVADIYGPATRRLHERLSQFRESAFGEFPEIRTDKGDAPTAKSEQQPTAHEPAADEMPQDQLVGDDDTAADAATVSRRSDNESVVADSPAAQPTLASQADSRPNAEPEEQPDAQLEEQSAAQSQQPLGTQPEEQPLDTPEEHLSDQSDEQPRGETPVMPDQTPLAAATGSQKGEDVLFVRQSPMLDVRTAGPRRITVGKESTYVVAIRNSGSIAADGVVVFVDLPEWTELLPPQPSRGTAGWSDPAAAAGPLLWKVGRLEADCEDQLVLKVIPRTNRPFDLTVRWDYTPAASQALIEVQEPVLEMQLEGPDEILYGAKEIYRLSLSNSGSGDAENVEISLLPKGTGNNTPVSHRLGTLVAGETKTFEVELTARQPGALAVEIAARGDSGAEARLIEEIVVLRPALKAQVDAPKVNYSHVDVRYVVRLSNPGTAPAKNVKLVAVIPADAEYVSSLRGGQLNAQGNRVIWTLESLDVGAEESFELVCRLKRPGANTLAVESIADGELAATAEVSTLVETMADLVLTVQDPAGPVPVGTEATYRAEILNRGSDTARDVEIIAYFSRGIEPTTAAGGRHSVGPGQVVFDPVPALAPGEKLSLTINAQAATSGNHIFRVEVYCKKSAVRLVSEEMTHYYGSSVPPQQARSASESSAR